MVLKLKQLIIIKIKWIKEVIFYDKKNSINAFIIYYDI